MMCSRKQGLGSRRGGRSTSTDQEVALLVSGAIVHDDEAGNLRTSADDQASTERKQGV